MKRHFDEELKRIKDKLFRMGLLVVKAVENSAQSLFDRDNALAESVIHNDQEINLQEIEIDEMGHELIALYQPAATDLRLLTMILKITNDLERMGDQAVNIAQGAIIINQSPPLKPFDLLPEMSSQVRSMVRDVLTAFMDEDVEKANLVLEKDDTVDNINAQIYDEMQILMSKRPETVRIGVALLLVSHNLERIADLATNISEDVIYLDKGIDIRHHIRERRT